MKASEEKALGREKARGDIGEGSSPIMASFDDPFMGHRDDP